jgi:hypothetical protein
MFYHRKLSKYKYKLDSFKEILEFSISAEAKWENGIDQNGISWSVEELPLDYSSFPILKEIFESIDLEFKRPSFFLSRVPSVGLANHIDHRKWGNLGFPLTEGFGLSTINFHDPFNQIVEKLILDDPTDGYSEPFIINTRMTHSAVYGGSQRSREPRLCSTFLNGLVISLKKSIRDPCSPKSPLFLSPKNRFQCNTRRITS